MNGSAFFAKNGRNTSHRATHMLSLSLIVSLIELINSSSPVWADSSQFDLSSIQPPINIGTAIGTGLGAGLGLGQLPQPVSGRTPLPVVSTGSVDINSVDMPFLKSNGGNGAFPQAGSSGGASGNGGSGGSSGSQIPPDLPPGYAAVMCHGTYAGAIPPGGNVEDFWRGAYGFSGDAAQQAALMREGEWLRQNGQI